MQSMGIEAVGPKPHLSQAQPGHRVYPYLLRDVAVERVDQVWSCDITYIRLRSGFVYLMAILDWFSRYVLAWELSVALDGPFCRDALDRALASGRPEIFNTDQGAQLTSDAFSSRLRAAEVQISMDGRGRVLDNVIRRAALAVGEVRGGVPEGLRVGAGSSGRAEPLLRVL